MKIKYFALYVSLLFVSCKAQKTTIEYKETIKVDTFIREQVNTIYKGVKDTIIIESPCDSLGILNKFYSKVITPNGYIEIKSKGSKLLAITSIDDIYTSNISKTHKANKESYNTIIKETIKYRVPSWAIYALIIETLVIAGYIYFRIVKI